MSGEPADKRLRILIEVDGENYFDREIVVSTVRFTHEYHSDVRYITGDQRDYETGGHMVTIDYREVRPL